MGSNGATSNFLRGDGTWVANGSGTVTSVGLTAGNSSIQVSGSTPITSSGTWTITGTRLYVDGSWRSGDLQLQTGNVGDYPSVSYPSVGVIQYNLPTGSSGQVLKHNGIGWTRGTDNIGMSSWNFSVNGGAAYNMGDGWNQNFANGTGISWSRSGQTLTATNTGDLSNTNELQTLSFSSPNLSISGSGGNSVALPVLPSGSTNQTLRHDGSSWSSTSGVTVTSGNRMDINSWPGTVNLGSKLLVNGHIQYTNTGFAATTLTGRDGDGGLTSVGVGSGLSLASGTLSATDASISNEGSLTVGAGSSTTSTISSNTSGSTPITLSAGNGLIISEPGSNTVELDKYREYAHVYGDGSQNITTTTSNVQIAQGDVTPVNMTVNPSSDRINTAGGYTAAYKWTVFGTIYNSSTTPSEVRVSMLRNGVVSYSYDEIDITCGQGNTNFSMSGISGGSANFGWQVSTLSSPSGILQLHNFHATVERL